MGALSGTMTVTTYRVDGEPPAGYRESYIEALTQHRFRDIDVHADMDESIGWANIHAPFEREFMLDNVIWGTYLMAALRQDQIRLPATTFKLHVKQALTEHLQKTGKERLSKADKDEVRDHMEKALRKKVLPAIRVHDMVWNLERAEVSFFTANKRMNDIFMDRFTQTFGLTLVPSNAYTQLAAMGIEPELIDHAVTLEPTSFSIPPRGL